MKQITDNPMQADVIYAAGFFDGEGSFGIYNGSGPSRKALVFVCSVWQSYRPVLEWYVETFGGGIFDRKPTLGKAGFEWRVTGHRAAWFINLIQPFLKVRQADAELALWVWEAHLKPEERVVRIAAWKARRAAATTKREGTSVVIAGGAIV
jgi:hypothetical protein